MDINISENQFREICSVSSKSLVGKVCKRLELLESQNLTIEQYRQISKALSKELIYESYRDLAFSVSCASKRMSFSMEIIKPSKEN